MGLGFRSSLSLCALYPDTFKLLGSFLGLPTNKQHVSYKNCVEGCCAICAFATQTPAPVLFCSRVCYLHISGWTSWSLAVFGELVS